MNDVPESVNRHAAFASLCRISDLPTSPFEVTALPQVEWDTGDYVVGEVTSRGNSGSLLELTTGRMVEVAAGDVVVGALGVRAATLEAVGHWRNIGPEGQMQALTGAGLFGRATSASLLMSPLVDLAYRGHAMRDSEKLRMKDFVPAVSRTKYSVPTVLLIGTSMSSGKTTSGKIVVRQLKGAGLRVAGTKLTGAGRYRDTLGMGDAGADVLYDFVDAGLPSTVVSPEEYRDALHSMLSMIEAENVDVAVAEAGASPLEPYNGDVLIREIREQVVFTILCASDPYAVLGVTQGYGFQPDLVAGVATSTSAGIDVIQRLTGCEALNLLDPESHPRLNEMLRTRLGL